MGLLGFHPAFLGNIQMQIGSQMDVSPPKKGRDTPKIDGEKNGKAYSNG